jgi:hypothetical protein
VDGFQDTVDGLDLGDNSMAESVNRVYTQWQQTELSACLIGANPNAVARAYKAGVLSDSDLQRFSLELAKRVPAPATDSPDDVARARHRARTAFLVTLETEIRKI